MVKKFRNYITYFLFLALVITLGLSIMKMIDLSITIDHQVQEISLVKKKCQTLAILADIAKDGITKPKIEIYLENSNDKHIYFEKKDNQIVIDGISLYFSGNSLETIEVGLE